MYVQRLSSFEFLAFVADFVVVVSVISRFLPGRAPPLRTETYPEAELHAHDGKLAKYFMAGGLFLVLGALHMVAKNLPWAAVWLARAGYAGHLVRDLSNTHVMIVGGGTLIATGLCWYALPRMVRRPLASNGLAQCAFWFTAAGLTFFYVALVANGIAIGRLVTHGVDYRVAKASQGNWYKVPVGMGAGVMGVGYWCFAANVFLTVFQARLLRVPKPDGHLAKFFLAGAAGLTAGTVQGVIQVEPKHADWLYRAGHAGEWIDPISHAHVNLVTGLTMLVAGALLYMLPRLGGAPPSRRAVTACFWTLLCGSLAFYGTALGLGLHEGHLVVARGLTPEQAEEATPLHPFLIMGAGCAMLAAFWLLLSVVGRSAWRARGPVRVFVLAGCAALAVGTLQGPVQAFPAVNQLLDSSGDAGDVIVNLHAQLNMLGGLMVMLVGLALSLLPAARPGRRIVVCVGGGMAVYYAAGILLAALEAHDVTDGVSFGDAVAAREPWQALVLGAAAVAVLAGFGGYARDCWRATAAYRAAGRRRLRAAPAAYAGPRPVPRHVRRRRPLVVAASEVPLGLLGFPGVGWLFAGFPTAATVLLIVGPALSWAVIPLAFSPFGDGPLRTVGWRAEFGWLAFSTAVSAAALYRAHRRRLRPAGRVRRPRGAPSRARVLAGVGTIALVLVALPVIGAVVGVGRGPLRYAYQSSLPREVTGQFLTMPRGPVKLFTWSDPQNPYPADALRVPPDQVRSLLVRAAAIDRIGAYQLYDVGRGATVPLAVARRSATTLQLAPRRPLAPGRYMFSAAHEGMFGGRDFAYLEVVGPGVAATPIAATSRRGAPAVLDALLPLAAALVAAVFCGLLAVSFRRRAAGEKLLWAIGFALFAVAAGSEALAQRAGWSAGLFRAYYLAGGVLTVAYLGAGSAWLQLPRRGRDLLAGALAVATAAALVSVLLAPVDAHLLAATPGGRPPDDGALGGHAYLWAVALNVPGTLALVGGALYSIARRRRVRANAWIAAGAIILALATSLSRAGEYALVYAGELVGIAVMFYGFAGAGARKRVAAP